jgi:hypothetical protein
MSFLHRSIFVSISLSLACNPSGGSTNPDAGNYDGYYSEKPAGSESGTGTSTDGSGVTANGYDPSLYEDVPSITDPAKKKKRRKGKIEGGKKSRDKAQAKKRKNRKAKNKFEVALDGVLPTAASQGSLVEVFGSGLDQKDLIVAIGGKPMKIVEAKEDRVVIQVAGVKGGRGKLALGKKDAAGKFKAFEETAYEFEVLGKQGLGPRKQVDHGLVGNVYTIDSEVTELPQFQGEPAAVIAVDNLDVVSPEFKNKIANRTEWFGVHFRGSLNVVAAGEYEFCLNSDDGAQLYLDEGLVLNNDGVHEAKEVCDKFTVEPGEYQLDLLWFQAKQGPLALQLTWAKDGGKKEPIPFNAFFPPADAADMAR